MKGLESVDSFQLNDEGIADQKVQAISAIQVDLAITDWKGHLPLKRDLQAPELMTETDLIGRFHKPWSEGPMDINSRSDDAFAELILFHASLSQESTDPALLFARLRSCGFSASSAFSAVNQSFRSILPGFWTDSATSLRKVPAALPSTAR